MEDAQQCISQYDEEGDGSLAQEEFDNIRDQIIAQQGGGAEDDNDNQPNLAVSDTRYSAQDLAAACNLSEDEALSIISQYDPDGDGALSHDDFAQQQKQQQEQEQEQEHVALDSFDAADEDNDGKLSAQELAEDEAAGIIQRYDEDGDGMLDKDEFAQLKAQVMAPRQEREHQEAAALDMSGMDEDQDGKVSAEELAKATHVSLSEAQPVIQQHDQNGDGMLDADEFEQLKAQVVREKERLQQIQKERQQRQQAQQEQYADASNSNSNAEHNADGQQFKHKWKFGMNFEHKEATLAGSGGRSRHELDEDVLCLTLTIDLKTANMARVDSVWKAVLAHFSELLLSLKALSVDDTAGVGGEELDMSAEQSRHSQYFLERVAVNALKLCLSLRAEPQIGALLELFAQLEDQALRVVSWRWATAPWCWTRCACSASTRWRRRCTTRASSS